MPFFNFTCETENHNSLVTEILERKSQFDIHDSSNAEMERKCSYSFPDDEGENSYLATFRSSYRKLPDHLRSCLDYCCIFTQIERGKLVRLLLAEGLIQGKPGEIMEDVAAKNIEELVVLGMVRELDDGAELEVSGPYRQLSLCKVEKHDFVTTCANSPIRVMIRDDGKDIPPNFKSLIIRSLFVVTAERLRPFYSRSVRQGLSQAYLKAVCGLKFLLVLDLDGEIEYLPDEVGDLVHLRYLGLVNSDLNELPATISKLQQLQTLDIRMCGKINELKLQSIQQLRHLIMSKSIDDGEIRVPKEIGTLVNLHTCCGLYAGGGIANELSRLTQLRELGVKRVSEDHASELAASIMKMVDLISLSLAAEETFFEDTMVTLFPSLEPFSPPPLLQELFLHGGLVEIPNWLASMENLTRLTLSYSYLSENPTSVLQFLPKWKHLILFKAYKAKHIGKEFCTVGGFAKLESLRIASEFLVEWTEIENGALPSLKHLSFNCSELRFLPEGLQNIFTLEKLCLFPLHHDLARRLKGEENYKIKNISVLKICHPFPSTYPE